MTLFEFVGRYLEMRAVSPAYAATLKKRAAKLEVFAGRGELRYCFHEQTINAFLAQLEGVTPITKNKYRQDFLAVWRAAADLDLVPYPQARRLRKERVLPQVVECYQEGEARSLLGAAEKMAGAYPNGVARRHYWPAVIRAGWDTGLRRGDLWRLRSQQIRKDGTAIIVQSKTASAVMVRFHRSTIQALEAAGGSLEWVMCAWCFSEHFQEIVKDCGINRGTFKWLRRGSGSIIEAEHPGGGHKQLGNTEQVFRAHYDAKLGDANRPMVPEL